MKTYGFGIIGCGLISRFHAKAINAIENARLVAVSDIVHKATEAFGEEYGVATYTDYKEMIARDDIDIVCVCTPGGAHMEPAIAAAEAKKHVVVEKPLEVTLHRIDRIIEACRENGVKLCGIFQSRFSDAARVLKDAIEAGRFGRVTLGSAYVKWHRTQEYYDRGGWRGTWALDGGGALMNQSIHAIDLLLWFMGPVDAVTAFCATRAHERIEVEDVAVAALKFKNGALGVIEGTTAAYPGTPKRVEVCGFRGSAVQSEENLLLWEFEDALPADEEIRAKFSVDQNAKGGASDPGAISFEGHRRQLLDFIQAVDSDKAPLVSGIEARKAVEVILAIYRSAQTGEMIRLPLSDSIWA